MNKPVCSTLFAVGLLLIVFRMEISRYVSDADAILAAGCILSLVSGAALLVGIARKRSE